jgi:pilus assembly protein CpaB
MRPKSMVLIVIALVCGLVASIGISQVVEKNSANNNSQVQTKPIFVATTDLNIGAELNANCVKLEEWPLDKVPPGAVTEASQLDGKSPSQRLYSGEPLLIAKLADANSIRGLTVAKTIRKGYRVMSVNVDMASAVSGLIHPGDRVDVLAMSGPTTSAEMILTNIEVFAINDKTTVEVDTEQGKEQARTVSLLVTSDQARKLMGFSTRSTISLSLRRPDDESGPDADSLDTIVSREPVVQPQVPAFQPELAAAPRDQYYMDILEGGSSSGVRRYAFSDRESLPHEVTSSDGEAVQVPAAGDFPFPHEGKTTESPAGGPPKEGGAPASARASSTGDF